MHAEPTESARPGALRAGASSGAEALVDPRAWLQRRVELYARSMFLLPGGLAVLAAGTLLWKPPPVPGWVVLAGLTLVSATRIAGRARGAWSWLRPSLSRSP